MKVIDRKHELLSLLAAAATTVIVVVEDISVCFSHFFCSKLNLFLAFFSTQNKVSSSIGIQKKCKLSNCTASAGILLPIFAVKKLTMTKEASSYSGGGDRS